jgi:chromosome segregation ATPase
VTPVAVVLWALAGVTAVGAAVKAWPAVWSFLCLPGRVEERLQKLDKLDAIEATSAKASQDALRAATIAEEAHEEWKGATGVVRREMGHLSDQQTSHESRLGRHDSRLNDLDVRLRKIEGDRP